MESLTKSLVEYGRLLKDTDLQRAFKGLMEFMMLLRADLRKQYPDLDVSENFYQGYLDISFFTISSKELKEKGLKVAVVYRHDQVQFEGWLAGRNREIMSKYHKLFSTVPLDGDRLSADETGMSSIIERILVKEPDFDRPEELKQQITNGINQFMEKIEELLSSREEPDDRNT